MADWKGRGGAAAPKWRVEKKKGFWNSPIAAVLLMLVIIAAGVSIYYTYKATRPKERKTLMDIMAEKGMFSAGERQQAEEGE